jgi:hypothetical protein
MSDGITAVFGIYSTHDHADAAVGTLRTKGFRTTDVSLLVPFVATRESPGAGGPSIGSATGVLIGLGIPVHQEGRYERRMRTGGILLSVHADDREWAIKGEQILAQTGAEDICRTAEPRVMTMRR